MRWQIAMRRLKEISGTEFLLTRRSIMHRCRDWVERFKVYEVLWLEYGRTRDGCEEEDWEMG